MRKYRHGPRLPAAAVLIAALMSGGAVAAQPRVAYTAPRNAFGAPNLTGVWTNLSLTTLERPADFKALVSTLDETAAAERKARGRTAARQSPVNPNAPAPPPSKGDVGQQLTEWGEADEPGLARIRGETRSSWIVDPPDGRLPLTPEASAAREAAQPRENFDGPEVRAAGERCLLGLGAPAGPPLLNAGYNANYQIAQSGDAVAIVSEMNHDARIVRLNERRHPPPGVKLWMGDSIGWWEGETLVVETTNIRPAGRTPLSVDAKVTERFTRTAPDEIFYEFKVEDPRTYTHPWRGEEVLRSLTKPIYEVACHEGNYSLPNILAGARQAEREAAGAKPAGPGG